METLDYQDSGSRNKVSTSLLLCKCFFLNSVHDGGTRFCSGWGSEAWKRSEFKKTSLSATIWTVKTLMHLTQIRNSPIKNLAIIGNHSMPTLMEEMEERFGENEFEYREKLKKECFLWEFRSIRILMQQIKTVMF